LNLEIRIFHGLDKSLNSRRANLSQLIGSARPRIDIRLFVIELIGQLLHVSIHQGSGIEFTQCLAAYRCTLSSGSFNASVKA